jgi:hypothetical protein
MKTTASNPARITVNPLVYLRRGGSTAPLLLVALIVSVIAFLVVKPESEKSQVRLRLIPVALGIFNVLNGVYTCRKAKSGDLNPGVVLQENPMLIGVLAEMNKGGADTEWFALKIQQEKVYGPDGIPLKVGTLIGTACEYGDSKDSESKGRWGDFAPTPINHYTTDAAVMDRALSTLSEDAWAMLEDAVQAIPDRRPGVYFLELTEDTGLTPSA